MIVDKAAILVQGIPAELAVLLLAMMPVIELRGALPLAFVVYKLPVVFSLILVIIGNMIPAFAILYGWDKFIDWVKLHWPWLHKKLSHLEEKTEGKWNEKIEKYGPWAIMIFVAVPLPGSGVWTGALAAWIFSLSKKKALLSLFAGVVLASILVTALTFGGLKLF